MQFSLQQFVILLENVMTHLNNNAELFKHFVLVTHDHGEKLWCENEVNVSCVEIICVFSLIIKAGEINSTAHYFPNLLWQWSKIIIETHCIGHVYFENIGLWNYRTYSLHAQSNFSNFTQLFFLMNLFTGQVLERARVRSVY